MEPERQLRVLHLEDCPVDRALIARMLEREGLECQFVHVRTGSEFETALREGRLDLILSDFSIPAYDGMAALRAARALQPDVPFLFVSGTIGEEKAVDSLKSGATDYVLKDRLARLGPAMRRALREAAERRWRCQAEEALRKTQEQLRQSQKLEAVGRLAGGVAHDFNNLLAVIRANADLVLLREESLGDESRAWLRQLLVAAERAGDLTRQLLAFARKQVIQPQRLHLDSVIDELTRLLGRIIGSGIRLRSQHAGDLPAIYADRGLMEQVVMNLVLNARDAMPHGGDLTVTTEVATVSDLDPGRAPEARVGRFIRLSVRDTGTGIAAEDLPRIFEPFFTTKDGGTGTGLGLATVYGIVRQHQGWIEVDTAVGQGTRIDVYLPASTDSSCEHYARENAESVRS